MVHPSNNPALGVAVHRAMSTAVGRCAQEEKMPIGAHGNGDPSSERHSRRSGLLSCSFRQATHGEVVAVPREGPAPAAADTHRSCWCAAITIPPGSGDRLPGNQDMSNLREAQPLGWSRCSRTPRSSCRRWPRVCPRSRRGRCWRRWSPVSGIRRCWPSALSGRPGRSRARSRTSTPAAPRPRPPSPTSSPALPTWRRSRPRSPVRSRSRARPPGRCRRRPTSSPARRAPRRGPSMACRRRPAPRATRIREVVGRRD
jgi:hypothetical protein